jgi:hypothetical protein
MNPPILDCPSGWAIGAPLGASRLASSALVGIPGGSQRCLQPGSGLRCAIGGVCRGGSGELAAPRRFAVDSAGVAGEPARRFHIARLSILATLADHWMAGRAIKASLGLTFLATFLIAFAVYEAALFVISARFLGGTEIYTAAIQGRIFAINAAAFVGLLVLNHLAASVGLARKPLIRLGMTERHA